MSGQRFAHFATDAVHAGQEPDKISGALVVPISLSTTFQQSSPGVHTGFEYSRSGNPTRNAYEALVAKLENGKTGISFASGLAATTTICHLAKAGEHIVSVNDVYGGTSRLFRKVLNERDVSVTFVDCNDLGVFEKAIKPNTKIVWIETPTNPTLQLVDIKACSAIAHKYPGVVVVCDNTFMSSYNQRPLDLGADISMHSVTKYMNGHSDVVGGILVVKRDDLAERLRYLQNAIGGVPSPFDCFLVMRGLKTLHLRMEAHERNATAIAKFLEANERVTSVIYPGLASHPQHELAKRQATGFGGMVSFRILGTLENSRKFLESTKIFALAESLGAVESLAELPAIMTHASIEPADRERLGITDTLIRLSVGVEDPKDLIDDVQQALEIAVPESVLAAERDRKASLSTKGAAAQNKSRSQVSSLAYGSDALGNGEKSSTRVSNPPGGRTQIFF